MCSSNSPPADSLGDSSAHDSPSTPWPRPQSFPELPLGTIHVWFVPLVSLPEEDQHLRGILSDDERQRADRFIFPRHQQQFATGRARLRQLIGSYLNVSPESLQFEYSSLGKPSLRLPEQSGFQFNFSNSHTVGLLAVSRSTYLLGVDVERVRHMSDMEGLARRFFAAPEIAAVVISVRPVVLPNRT